MKSTEEQPEGHRSPLQKKQDKAPIEAQVATTLMDHPTVEQRLLTDAEDAVAKAAELIVEEPAERLVDDHPRRVLAGRPVPREPRPIEEAPQQQSWWARLRAPRSAGRRRISIVHSRDSLPSALGRASLTLRMTSVHTAAPAPVPPPPSP